MARPVLHVVALAHLDTQWRWTARDTVERHLPDTVAANESLFERHPAYVLSFEGSWRYQLLAEHFPDLFARVRARVGEGRWSPAGAAVEAFDTLLPAPESILRQILYGRRWFARELGVDSRDLFLPDCFGFPSTLPTLARHAGIEGFSTQKLRRGPLMRSACGIPFAYGRWRGPDGAELLAALDPGEYSGRIEGALERDPEWIERFRALAERGGGHRLLLYVGTGDRGGAPPEATVAALERALAATGPIEVRHGRSEQIYADTSAEERAALPVYQGELLLRLHGTGCYTAKGAVKRWNQIGERWARVAEAASALALTAGASAPRTRLAAAWQLLLAHQMHDDLTGTSIPAAYALTLADLGFAVNEFAEIARGGVAAAAATLGGAESGVAVALLDPLGVGREELAEVVAPEGLDARSAVTPEGETVPLQRTADATGAPRLLLPARSRGVELALYRLSDRIPPQSEDDSEELVATEDRLANGRYAAGFDAHGRLASLFDRRLERELLAAPLELELLPDRSRKYPAWEIHWRDVASAPLARFEEVRERRVVERGPLRVALRIERTAGASVVRETWRLARGESGDLLECQVELDWRSRGRLLKLRFPFSATNALAAYDTGLGAIRRPLASRALYEVPAQHWAALEDQRGAWGTAVLADSRHGWDHPAPSALRLTLAHSPHAGNKFRHQATQDFGRQRFRFALCGLAAGAVDDGTVAGRADRWLHPPVAYRVSTSAAKGQQRRTLLTVPAPLRLLALKPAEDSPRALVARLQNPSDAPAGERFEATGFARGGALDGSEHALAAGGSAADDPIPPSALRTLLLSPAAPLASPAAGEWEPLDLGGDARGFSRRGEIGVTGFDDARRSFPLDPSPARLDDGPAPFILIGAGGRPRVRVSAGETFDLPGGWSELWLLGASVAGDRETELRLDDRSLRAFVPDWRQPLLVESRWSWRGLLRRLDPGRFRRSATVWSVGHLHDGRGRVLVLERASLFAVHLPLAGAVRLRLPDDRALRWVAATLVRVPAPAAVDAYPPLLP